MNRSAELYAEQAARELDLSLTAEQLAILAAWFQAAMSEAKRQDSAAFYRAGHASPKVEGYIKKVKVR